MLLRQDHKRQRRSAFTLMEMLVVVAIIVALAGIGGFFLLGALKDSQEDTAKIHIMGTLTPACEAYSIKRGGTFPPTLAVLLEKDALGGPYLTDRDKLKDPWGQDYQYEQTGTKNRQMKPDIWTVVPGSNPQKMIGNWPVQAQQ